MNAQTKTSSLIFLLALFSASLSPAQNPLRNIATSTFGDVAAIKQKAEAGDAKAQVAFGHALASKFRSSEALTWYRKAADQGNVEASYSLGKMLLFGAAGIPGTLTVKPVPTEGLRWTYQAATNHHREACYHMSKALRRGLGVSTNLVEAYAWLQLVADTGHIVGRVELNQMALTLDTSSIQAAKKLAARFKAGQFQPLPTVLAQPAVVPDLHVSVILFQAKKPLAVISGRTLAEGESVQIATKSGTLSIKCLKIEKNSVQIAVDGEPTPRLLHLK